MSKEGSPDLQAGSGSIPVTELKADKQTEVCVQVHGYSALLSCETRHPMSPR